MAAVGIIGAGTWGTALAVLLNNNGQDVTIWSAFDTEIQEMSRTRRWNFIRMRNYRQSLSVQRRFWEWRSM